MGCSKFWWARANRVLALSTLSSLLLMGCAEAQTPSTLTISYTITGAIQDSATLSHAGDTTHLCSAASLPALHTTVNGEAVEVPPGPPVYIVDYDSQTPASQPGVFLKSFAFLRGQHAQRSGRRLGSAQRQGPAMGRLRFAKQLDGQIRIRGRRTIGPCDRARPQAPQCGRLPPWVRSRRGCSPRSSPPAASRVLRANRPGLPNSGLDPWPRPQASTSALLNCIQLPAAGQERS